MKIYQSRSFEKKIKRYNKQEKTKLDNEIKKIIRNPSIGIPKKGDMKG
ncbi:MAG: type II toxin-antitoxin system RelE/ParE family toxin, partial [Deltaproteobacteria bacterium]